MIAFRIRIPSRVSLDFNQCLLWLFVALGPLGNLLTPHILPKSCRAYYFILLAFPIFYFKILEKQLKTALIFTPFFVYSFVSVIFVDYFDLASEAFPFFRFVLLLFHFLFVIGGASAIANPEQIIRLVSLYITSFTISLVVGYFFFIGYYLGIVKFGVIERFSVLAQHGYGLLRFSPGSYPNEYGIVSSFVLSIFTLISMEKNNSGIKYSRKILFFLFPLIFGAFLLATTRAAYIAYIFSFFYIAWNLKKLSAALIRIGGIFLFLVAVLFYLGINVFEILAVGFQQKIDQGSMGERYFKWKELIESVQEHPIWGLGFAAISNAHNVYLQLAFELGLIGTSILLISLLVSFVENLSPSRLLPDSNYLFLQRVRTVGLIHVLWFAFSNHNLNHHLTWFVIFLYLAHFVCRLKSRSNQLHDQLNSKLQIPENLTH